MIRVGKMPLYGEDNFFVEQEFAFKMRKSVLSSSSNRAIYIYIYFFSTDLNDV